LKRIRNTLQTFVGGLKPFADLRDSADMQDDRPTDADMLGRTQYAKALAKRINRMMGWGRPSDRTFLMIQLHAPWGAGKTSFMRLFAVSLRELPQSRWTIVWFNAWENQRISPPWWISTKKYIPR
jgi:predicted KAP-like P-loop ATPase